MTLPAGIAIWCIVILVIAALPQNETAKRAALLLAVSLLIVPVFVYTGPVGRLFLAAAALFCVVRVPDLFAPSFPATFWKRLLHLCAVIDTRLVRQTERKFDQQSAVRFIVALAIALTTLFVLDALRPLPPARWLIAAVFLFSLFETLNGLIRLAAGMLRLDIPVLHDAPYRSRSLTEFWAQRWNVVVSRILQKQCFRRCVRAGPGFALFATFAASALFHAYVAAVALGWPSAGFWGIFFLAQPLLNLIERGLHVRRRRAAAGWAWTMGTLGLLSPLFLEPFLCFVEAAT
jgi:hypothetical protein